MKLRIISVFTRPRRMAGLFFLAGIAACRGEKPLELSEQHQPSGQVLTCRVDPTRVGRDIQHTLFGTNLEWFNNADGIAHADGTVDPEWSDLARDEGISNIRFPGGTLSDYYHWRDGIGPVDQRPVRDHPTDRGRSPNVFGSPELIRFCAAAHAQPLITVNAGTGTAQEAADWVAYFNQPSNPDRAADGLPAPVNVKLWEIGNELYLPGNPTDKKKITIPPEQYADRFLEFAAAMRKVDPTIKLIAIGTANSTIINLPYPNWTETLLKKAAPQIDLIAVHNAYFPMIFGRKGLSAKEVYQSLWASPEAVDRSLSKLDDLLARYGNGHPIGIAVTEWGALFSNAPHWIDHEKTMGSAVYLARLMQVFINHPRVVLTDYFKFTDRTPIGWVSYDGKPKVPYYVIQMFARHFGTRQVAATVESPTFSVGQVGVAPAESDVPEVTAVAATDGSGRKLFVNLVNRSWQTIHQVRLDTGSFKAADAATLWELSSPGLTDHNGRDLPDELPSSMFEEPPVKNGAPAAIKIEQKTVDLKSPLTLQPYSIVTLELDAQS
ncbi:MAG TPA: alpha-L-arabinofuranosidase C-terminal domain-containing protein [Opitutaceae bacterium]|nr:alpha-L-arabinofuranosidase C-terminal domain-containing protein [Opitutaceae bacterium]